MKKKIYVVLALIIVLFFFLVGLYFYGLSSVKKNEDKVTFVIEPGAGKMEIIDNLCKNNIIRSKISSYIYLILHNDLVFKKGTYELSRNQSTRQIFAHFDKGSKDDVVTLTFYEGKRITDIATTISKNLPYSEDEVIKVMNDKEYLQTLIEKYDFLSSDILNDSLYYPLEGYLFSDTYEVYKNAKIEDVIEKMLEKTKKVLDNYSVSISESEKSIHEILTIASIIENETMYDEDKSNVSQVIYKRLDIGMSLGMDVTTYYGARKSLSETLSESELDEYNAYNTRNTSFAGLPVGPISSPSVKSIEAALNPSDSNYVYFYADKDGKLHFANNYNEFLQIKSKYS